MTSNSRMQITLLPFLFKNFNIIKKGNQLAFLTPPFLGGISAEVCEISPHNSDFLEFFGQMMVNFGRGSKMRLTVNEESDCLRKKNLRRHCRFRAGSFSGLSPRIQVLAHMQ